MTHAVSNHVHATFSGHSDLLTALAGYDPKSPLMGNPRITTPLPQDDPLVDRSGLMGGFFEVLVPPLEPSTLTETDGGMQISYPPRLDRRVALTETIAGLAALEKLTRQPGSKVGIARSIEDIERIGAQGRIAAVLHLADADSIDDDLDTLYVLEAAGVRSLAITWSRANAFGHGVPFISPGDPDVGPGLSKAGRRLIATCNELGILVDLAHLNSEGFADVAVLSPAPLVISHGAAHALSPTTRGTTDDQLRLIGASNGLIGISMEGVQRSKEGAVHDVVKQARYIADIAGPETVALGGDLFRRPDAAHPDGVMLLPAVVAGLADEGFSPSEIAQITWGNWRRVLSATWH